MTTDERFQYLPIREQAWEYDGGYLKHCEECGKVIESGDQVVVEPYIYRDNAFTNVWHKECLPKDYPTQ